MAIKAVALPGRVQGCRRWGFRGESFGLTLVIQSMDDFSVFRQGSFGQAKAAAILVRCRLRRFPAPHERKPISPRG